MAFGDLCQLADVTAWLNTGTGAGGFPVTDNALLSRLITSASGFIVTWLNRPIVSAQYQEIRDGITGALGPREAKWNMMVTPITGVSSVVVGSLLIPQAPIPPPAPPGQQVSFVTFSPDIPYMLNPGWSFTPSQVIVRGYYVPRATGIVTITYTGGFYPIPPDIQQACIELVCFKYRERTRIGERSRRIGDEVVSYVPRALPFSIRDMTTDIQSLLWQYRRQTQLSAAMPTLVGQTDTALLAGGIT